MAGFSSKCIQIQTSQRVFLPLQQDECIQCVDTSCGSVGSNNMASPASPPRADDDDGVFDAPASHSVPDDITAQHFSLRASGDVFHSLQS